MNDPAVTIRAAAQRPPALAGLRVVEFSAFVAAPVAGLTLVQLGAEVVRVDPLGGNIDARRMPLNAQGNSLYWAGLNAGKQSVTLDVRGEQGRKLLRDLIFAPQNGPPIFLSNLAVDGELSYEALCAVRPDLVMVQLSGSQDGGNALDYTVNCAVGFPYVTGADASGPVNHVLPAWDMIAGVLLANAILAGERHWSRTGQGQLIRMSLSDVAMWTVATLGYIADVEINRAERRADGNFLYGAYGDAFDTADGRHVMVVAITNRQWRALADAIGMTDALDAAAAAVGLSLGSESGRYEARELVSAIIRPWFSRRTLGDIAAALAGESVLWGPYRSFAQMLEEDPRCSPANPMFARVRHPGYGEFLTASSPLRFGASETPAPAAAPRIGQDTARVLKTLLGLDDAALAHLVASGTISAFDEQ